MIYRYNKLFFEAITFMPFIYLKMLRNTPMNILKVDSPVDIVSLDVVFYVLTLSFVKNILCYIRQYRFTGLRYHNL